MFENAYATSILKRQKLDRIKYAVNLAKVEDRLYKNVFEKYPFLLVIAGKSPVNDTIGPFNHPLPLDDGHTIIDLRPFNSQIQDIDGRLHIPKTGPATLLVKHAILQKAWEDDSQRKNMASLGEDFAMNVFANWVGESISRRLGVDPNQAVDIVVICAWYYRCLFSTKEELVLDDESMVRYAGKISRLSYASTLQRIHELIELVGYIGSVEELILAIKKLDSKRLDNLSSQVFYTILVGGWFGSSSSRELVAVALEHPPTFIGILYAALTERMYRKSPITTVAERLSRRNANTIFIHAVDTIVRNVEE